MPTVSIVIPVYNAADVIAQTLDSALDQTWADREVIVIDDGSTDASGDIVRSYGPRVQYHRTSNRGVAAARNRGIALAAGVHIALLDHDDLWAPTKLERQMAVMESRPEVGLVVTDVAHLDHAGRPMGIIGPGYNPAETFARLFVQGYVPTPSAALIRRAVLDAVGGFDERFQSAGMDDHELWTRIAASTRIACVAEPLTFHRNRERKPAAVGIEHRGLLIDLLLRRFGDDPERRRYLLREQAAYLADLGRQQARDGNLSGARASYREALSLAIGRGSWKTAWRCLHRMARTYLGGISRCSP